MAAESKKAVQDLSDKLRTQKLRTGVAAVVFVVMAAGLILGVSTGTMSGFGWETISALCPLGAIATMLATKTMVPRAVISLVIMAVLIFLLGRAFCSWLCPSMLIARVREFFRTPKKRREMAAATHDQMVDIAKCEIAQANEAASLSACSSGSCGSGCTGCASAKQPHGKLDSRHYVLGGALLSTAIFGFPVFCLVCPVGLTFATVLVVWRLFAAGDMTIAVILVPALLIVELVFLRKWCTRFCPLSALMNLVSRFSRTFVPVIDDAKCLETSQGVPCSRCAQVCESDINLRHIAYGERTLADCSRCRNCADVCPTKAISFPVFVPGRAGAGALENAGSRGGVPSKAGANGSAPAAEPAVVMLDEDTLEAPTA